MGRRLLNTHRPGARSGQQCTANKSAHATEDSRQNWRRHKTKSRVFKIVCGMLPICQTLRKESVERAVSADVGGTEAPKTS